MKLKKYSALVCGVLASAIIVACSGGNGTSNGKQTLTPMSTSNASVKALTVATNGVANLRSIAKGNGVYVAVGDGGAILTSTDGQKWGSVSSGVSIDIHQVTFNDSTKLFYAVGDKSTVLSSANGTSWTQYKSLIPSENLYSIMSVGGDLVIGAESSTIFEIDTNDTGVVTVRTTVNNMKLISAAHGNGVMVLGSDDGSILYKSENNWGANWSKASQFSGMSINGLSYESADHWFLAGTSTGKVIRSGNGVVWSSPVTASSFIINSVILDDKSNDFFAVGGSSGTSMMVTSNNYNSWNPLTLPFNNVQFNDVKCFGNNDCFVVGDNGAILAGLKRDPNTQLPIWVAVGGPDVTAPTVVMSSPLDKATNVSKSPSIQIQFSEPVKNVSISNVSLHLGSPAGALVAINSVTGGADNVYTINVSGGLSSQMTYFVVIGNGITDLAGNPLLATNFSFTTGDFTAPTVVMSSPVNQSSGISKNPSIQIQFSEAVLGVESNVSLRVGSATGATVAISKVTSGSDNTYVFNPSAALSDTTTYYIVVGSGVTDTSGNALVASNLSFTTGDFTAPTVAMISPANNASNVAFIPTIQLQFSEAVKNVTLTNVSLRESSPTGTAVTLGAIASVANNGYNFSPLAALKSKTVYYVVIESGVTDTSGNALPKSQFNFSTAVLVKSISAGSEVACDIIDSGQAYCWGSNFYGQLGNGTKTSSSYPVPVSMPTGVTSFTSISAGSNVTCGIGNNGRVYCWGSNNVGQLGTGVTNQTLPVLITLPSGVTSFTTISTGGNVICALGSVGSNSIPYCWGVNDYGQLGNGTTTYSSTPVAVKLPTGVTSFKSISASDDHVCGVGNNGLAYCWGLNNYYQLGNGTKTSSSIPAPVTLPSGVTSFVSISAGVNASDVGDAKGSSTTCGIGNNGVSYCWGASGYGQLGNGSIVPTITSLIAVSLPSGVNSFTSILNAGPVSCGIGSNSLAYCWGYNAIGQIGSGSYSSSSIPVAVKLPTGVTSFVAIDPGNRDTCAIGNNGSAYCWGYNVNGQLGNGTTTNSNAPVLVIQ